MRILIPLDGSSLAEQAIRPAIAYAQQAAEAPEILLARVVQPNYYTDLGFAVGAAEVLAADLQQADQRAETYLESLIQHNYTPGLTLRAVVLDGNPAEALSAFVQEAGIDFMYLTSHGRTGLSRMVMGSVAERLAREARVPTVLFRPDQGGMFQLKRDEPFTILVPLDGSELSESIIDSAAMLARTLQGAIRLVRVVPPMQGSSLADKMLAQEVERELSGIQQRLESRGITTYQAISWGEPVERIVAAAQEYQTDLIAMATHGRVGVDQLRQGSMMLDIWHHTKLPMLVFHPPESHPCWQAHPLVAWETR